MDGRARGAVTSRTAPVRASVRRRVVGVLAVPAFGCLGAIACSGAGSVPAPAAALSSSAAHLGEPPIALAAAASASSAPPAAPPSPTWIDAARIQRWSEVARGIDALPEAERNEPGTRYVRARAAQELGDSASVAALLRELEKDLPLLSDDILRTRARAALDTGAVDDAVRWYGGRDEPRALLRAARAERAAGRLPQAARSIELALRRVTARRKHKSVTLEAEIRLERSRVLEARGDLPGAAAELRHVLVTAPTLADDAAGVEHLALVAPKAPLTRRERFERARLLAASGLEERALAELAALDGAPGAMPARYALAHVRAEAAFVARRDDVRAAELCEIAAKLGGPEATVDWLRAGRARARSGDDAAAAVIFDRLARGGSKQAEHARFFAARARSVQGQFELAEKLYLSYLARHPRGTYARSARHEAAISALAAGHTAPAAKALQALEDATEAPRQRVEYTELRGVVAQQAGDRKLATRLFREVIDAQPLSLVALLAGERLAQLGEPRPAPIATIAPRDAEPELVIELPDRVALLHRLGLDADAERELGKQEASFAKRYAPRGDEALCRAYSELAGAARRYQVAQRAADGESLSRAPDARSRWIWDCLYPRPYQSWVRELEQRRELPRDFAYAVMRQESAFKPSVVSPARAVGLMQLIPATAESAARELAIDFDRERLAWPSYNLELGSFYLKKVLGTFGGHVALAAAAYNAGPSAVSRWLASGESLPLDVFVARIPYEETRAYVHRVVGNWARYAYAEGGEAALPALGLELPHGLRAPSGTY